MMWRVGARLHPLFSLSRPPSLFHRVSAPLVPLRLVRVPRFVASVSRTSALRATKTVYPTLSYFHCESAGLPGTRRPGQSPGCHAMSRGKKV